MAPIRGETPTGASDSRHDEGISALDPSNKGSVEGSVDGSMDYVHAEVEEGEEKEEADVYGCAHSNGLPVCGFVKANLDGETESRNVEEKVCGDAYTCGCPTSGLVKVHPNDRIHKSAHSCESSTCGHCDYTEPSSRTEPTAPVSSCAHSNGLPVCGFVRANSEMHRKEKNTSTSRSRNEQTAAAEIMLKSAESKAEPSGNWKSRPPPGILKNNIQEPGILKNKIQEL